ncbi:MAG: hypothetical protein ACRDRL_16275 [Sciscionella sp.]
MPTPLELQVTATTDASGNATISKVIRGAFWSAVYATCQCAGSGAWVFGPNGQPRFFQEGANVILGPLLLAPGGQASVQVAGATPAATVTVDFWGAQGAASDGSDLVQLLSSVETAGSLLGITGPVSIGGNVGINGNVPVENVPGGAITVATPKDLLGIITLVSSAGSLTVTPSSRAIGLSLVYQGVTASANAHVAGAITGAVYLPTTQLHSGGPVPLETEIEIPADASYVVSLGGGVAGDKLIISEVTAPTIITLGGSTVNLPSEVYAANNGGTGAAAVAIDSDGGAAFTSGRFNLAVSNRWALPAPWQSPTNYGTLLDSAPAAGSKTDMILGVAAQAISLFGFTVAFTAAITSKFSIRDSAGNMIWVTQGGGQQFEFDRSGLTLATATGLQFWNESSVAVGVTVTGGWNQQ